MSKANRVDSVHAGKVNPFPCGIRGLTGYKGGSTMEELLQKKVTIRLDDARFNELLKCSRREGFSVSTIVRHLVYRYVEQQRQYSEIARG